MIHHFLSVFAKHLETYVMDLGVCDVQQMPTKCYSYYYHYSNFLCGIQTECLVYG